MARRLRVILHDPEYREIQHMARSRHMSIAEWVRKRWIWRVTGSLWEVPARNSKSSGRRRSMTIPSVISTACWPRSRRDTELVCIRDSDRLQYPDVSHWRAHPHKSDAQRAQGNPDRSV